jgi:sirohydrochlorin cobaltochelatase
MIDDYSGILLIGHGTRDASGTKAFSEIVDSVRHMLPGLPVEVAFLEFAEPTIAEGIAKLAGQGGNRIAAVPVFLSAFGHTRDDIPKAVAVAAEGSGFHIQGSGVRGQGSGFGGQSVDNKISIMQHVGSHQRIVELSALRYRQALEGKKDIPTEETLLIIAGHGSPEPEAIQELAEFAARREKLTPVSQIVPCFAVLGKPQLTDVLKQSASLPYKRIVVQPHLLLRGRFYESICNLVETCHREYPEIDWIVTEPLGPDQLLAQAIVESLND